MKVYRYLNYAALLLGLLVSLFFTLFLIVDSVIFLTEGKTAIIAFLLIMCLAVTGYILAVFKPAKGGMVMIAGGLLLAVYLLIKGGIEGWQMSLIFGLPFILPGIFFMSTSKKYPGFWFTFSKTGK